MIKAWRGDKDTGKTVLYKEEKNMNTKKWKDFLEEGIKIGAYPSYAVAIGRGDDLLFRSIGGYRALYPTPISLTEDTLFDMASLSKLIGTTMATLRLIEKGRLSLDDRIGDFFDDCHEKEGITIFDLMTHTSGIPSFFHMWKMDILPSDAVNTILSYPLSARRGEKVIYSCMGYILLGKILEKICGEPLDVIVKNEVLLPLSMLDTCYCPSKERICVSTEKKVGSDEYICGHVHDENAHFLGGVSGNAGLFSTLDDLIKFAGMLSREGEGFLQKSTFDMATKDYTGHFSEFSRGLGFQLYGGNPYPGGTKMSLGSYGHSGFTGTYLYVDRESKIYCIFLSNRVHFGRDTDLFYEHKLGFFDMVFTDVKEMKL